MKKFINLIRNESLKQYKKTSVLVFAIILVLLAIAGPVLMKVSNNFTSSMAYYSSKSSEKEMEELENAKKDTSDLNEKEKQAHSILYNDIANLFEYCKDKNLSVIGGVSSMSAIGMNGSSLNNQYGGVYQDIMIIQASEVSAKDLATYEIVNSTIQLGMINLALQGYDQPTITRALEKFKATSLSQLYYANGENNKITIASDDQTQKETFTTEELNKLKQKHIDNIKKMKETIQDNDYTVITEQLIERSNEKIKMLNNQISLTEKEALANPKDDELQSKLASLKQDKAAQQQTVEVYQMRSQYNIGYDKDDWKNKTLMAIQSYKQTMAEQKMTEQEFIKKQEAGQLVENYKNYDQYSRSYDAEKEIANNNYEKAKYSLENDIPLMNMVKSGSSARSDVASDSNNGMQTIALFMAMVAGAIISTEISKGTIRLLLTRPVSRTKIMFSKYISLLITSILASILTIVINMVTTGILKGFDDLFVPVISYNAGEITQTNFFVWLLPHLAQSFVFVILVISVGFAASTLFKNTAAATAVGMMTAVSYIPTAVILMMFPTAALSKTPIPYLNICNINASESGLNTLNKQLYYTLNIPLGITMLLLISAICVAVAIIVFKKRDVNN